VERETGDLSGTLDLKYAVTGALIQLLFAGVMAGIGYRAWLYGVWGLTLFTWLFAGLVIFLLWRGSVRAIRWFRLEDDTLVYRKLCSGGEQCLPLASIRQFEPVEAAKSTRVIGFNLVREPDGARLYFPFLLGFGGRELFAELQRRQQFGGNRSRV
jgi:hypothetical protein